MKTDPLSAATIFGFYGVGYASSFFFPLKLCENCLAPDRKTLFMYLTPVMITLLAESFVYDLAVVAAKQLLGLEAAARFGVAVRNLLFIRALFTVFMMLYPVIYFREMDAGRFGLVRIYRIFILISTFAFCFLMALFAPLLYRVTGAGAYLDAVNLFRLLTAAAFCDFAFNVFGLFFQQQIKTWKNALVKIFSMTLLLIGLSLVACVRTSPACLTCLALAVLAAAGISSFVGVVWAWREERMNVA